MQLGKVVSRVVSTKKNEQLTGSKLLVVQLIKGRRLIDDYLVAVDGVGAGEGEVVLLAAGSAARIGLGKSTAPIDAAVVGIVDEPEGVLDT